MDFNIGLGIGLQGKPDMHLGMVAARQRAKDAYDAKKAKAAEDALRRAQNAFSTDLKGQRYLPVHEAQVAEKVMGALDLMRSGATSGEADMMSINQATYGASVAANKAFAQRKQIEQVMQRPGDYGVSNVDYNILYNERDPIKLKERLEKEGSGAFSYDPETGEIKMNLLAKYNPVGDQFSEYVQKRGDYIFNDPAQNKKVYKVGNTNVYHGTLNDQVKEDFMAFSLTGDNLLSTAREYNISRPAGTPQVDYRTPEGQKVLRDYVSGLYDKGAEALIQEKYYKDRSQFQIINNLGADPEGAQVVWTDAETSNIYSELPTPQGMDGGYTVTALGGMSFGTPIEFTTAVPAGTVNSKTRKPIKGVRGTLKGSKVVIVPVAKKTVKGKINGIEVTYNAGEVIPDQFIVEAGLTTGYDYQKRVEGEFKESNSSTWSPVYFPVQAFISTSAVKLNSKMYSQLDARVRQLNQNLKQVNSLDKRLQQQIFEKYKGNLLEAEQDINTLYQVRPQSSQNPASKQGGVMPGERDKATKSRLFKSNPSGQTEADQLNLNGK